MQNLIPHAENLIECFLSTPIFNTTNANFVSNSHVAKQCNSLRIVLPRGRGTTSLVHKLADKHKCLVLVANTNQSHDFRKSHLDSFHEAVECHGHWVLENMFDLKPRNHHNRLIQLQSIFETLDRSKIVICDVFSAYCGNKTIDKLFNDLGRTHKFVLMG